METHRFTKRQKQPDYNDKTVQYKLGVKFYRDRDYKQAEHWWEQSAQQGEERSRFSLSALYARGLGVTQSLRRCKKKAMQGDNIAQYKMGYYYDEGKKGLLQNDAMAIKWYQKSANNGYKKAQLALGLMYQDGIGVEQNDGMAVKYFLLAAEQNDKDALYEMGWRYAHGFGVPLDNVMAVKYYKQSAHNGSVEALFALGWMIYHGRGSNGPNPKKAVRYYISAAKKGSVQAQYHLADLYYYQKIETKGNAYKKAFRWFYKAARNHDKRAQYQLAMLYQAGHGVEASIYKAFKWLKKSAKQGMTDAQYVLALMYYRGSAGQTDHDEALRLFQNAAKNGHVLAQEAIKTLRVEHMLEGVKKEEKNQNRKKPDTTHHPQECFNAGANMNTPPKKQEESDGAGSKSQPCLGLM